MKISITINEGRNWLVEKEVIFNLLENQITLKHLDERAKDTVIPISDPKKVKLKVYE